MSLTNQYFFVNQQLRHPEWDRIKALPSNVLLQIKSNGIRILLLSDSKEEVWGLDEIQHTRNLDLRLQISQLEQFSGQSLLSEAEIKQVFVAYDSEIFSLVPNALYSPDQEKDILDLVSEIPDNSDLMSMPLSNPESVLVHAIPNEWKSWAAQLFESSETTWISALSGIINQSLELSKTDSEPILLAQVESAHVVLIGVENGKLLYVNRFQYKTENDLLYFILLALNELELNPASSKIILTGNILSGSIGFEKLARYLARLEFIRCESELIIPNGFEALRHHNYFDLLSLSPVLKNL